MKMNIRFPKILLCLSLLLTACSDDQEVVAQGLTDGSKGMVLRNQTIHSEILRRNMLHRGINIVDGRKVVK